MAYRVRLEAFEGPLDLLLYLIQKDELDIYNIPIARITEEYLQCLGLMQMLNIEMAGEFAVMAATLMQIKSQMLLPVEAEGEEEEGYPRDELARQLLEYAKYRGAADHLRERQAAMSCLFSREAALDWGDDTPLKLEAGLFDLVDAFSRVLASLPVDAAMEVGIEEVTVEEKVRLILDRLREGKPFPFEELFHGCRGRVHLIAAFLALLELVRLGEASTMQAEPFGTIFICAAPREASLDA